MKNKKLEAYFSNLETKIHRFPPGLLQAVEDRYVVPSFVALGPYHHGKPHLQHMEDVKHSAAHHFCRHSIEDVYAKIFDIADQARSCYDDEAVAHLGKADFAEMMFLDGCFLLMDMTGPGKIPVLLNRMTLSTGPCMLRDIFLLENQLPWLVLEALMTFTTTGSFFPYSFVVAMAGSFDITPHSSASISQRRMSATESLQGYRPPHLLGLLRYYQCSGIMHGDPDSIKLQFSSLCSAIELAEIGIELTASDKTWFADMSVKTDLRFPFAQLSLSPLFLNDFTACWLVNMAAYEACISTGWPSDGFLISSYISLLAMLIDKEEDVHEMRAKHIVQSFFSNYEVLVFFKGLSRHLRLGYRYFVITEKIEQFKRQRPVRIVLHRFVYNNIKTIVTLLSIASVLVGIFRTLMTLKQQHQQQQ